MGGNCGRWLVDRQGGREEGKALCIVVGGHLRVRGRKKEA